MNTDRYLSTFQTANAVAESRSQAAMFFFMLIVVAVVIVAYVMHRAEKEKQEIKERAQKEIDDLTRRHDKEVDGLQRRLSEANVDLKNARHLLAIMRMDGGLGYDAAGIESPETKSADVRGAQPAPTTSSAHSKTVATHHEAGDELDPKIRDAMSSM